MLRQSLELGSDIGEALRIFSEDMRDRRFVARGRSRQQAFSEDDPSARPLHLSSGASGRDAACCHQTHDHIAVIHIMSSISGAAVPVEAAR
jgi:hypothetical protein